MGIEWERIGERERKGAQNQTKGKGRTIDGKSKGANGQRGRKDGESAKGKRGARFPPSNVIFLALIICGK